MRTLPVRFGPEAESQLQAIETYIAQQGRPENGAEFAGAIAARCMKIGDLPYGGTPRDELFAGARSVSFKRSATIIYTIEDEFVVIQAVFYGGRDIGSYYR